MMRLSVRVLLATTLLLAAAGCDNVRVYGGVSVGSSWGGYHSGPSTRANISVSGRLY